MIQVREAMFETNSSSMHTICIARPDSRKEYDVPTVLHVDLGEFGWEWKKYSTPDDRASYIYTLADYIDESAGRQMKERIFKLCIEKGIDVEFDRHNSEWACVDHGSEARDFLESMQRSSSKLFDFIFAKDSCIFTGNDNSDAPAKLRKQMIAWDEEHPSGEIYYK